MSKQILIIGHSGSGKSTALRKLPPEETFYIDADGKGLNWKGWRRDYNTERKNYTTTTSVDRCHSLISNILEKAPHVKYIVIDTITNLLIAEEIHAMKQKGYDKWVDIAQTLYTLIEYTRTAPEDKTFIYTGLTETVDGRIRLKTPGQKLKKIELESLFNIVILMDITISPYEFILNYKTSTARAPYDFMENKEIVPGDILSIVKELEEY